MSVRTRDQRERPPLTDDVIASYLHGRGDVANPEGLLAVARAQVLQPVGIARPRLVLGFTAAVAVLIVAIAALTLPLRPAPTTPVAAPVSPARELIVATIHEAGTNQLVRAADPATALPVDDLPLIRVTQPFEPVLSPDGRTLAVVTTPPNESADGEPVDPHGGEIRLIALESWTMSDTPVTGLGFVRGLTWTPDSKALVWLEPTRTVADYPTGRAYRVMRWRVGSAAPEVLVDLPDPELVPLETRIQADAGRIPESMLVVYGRPVDASGALTGTPRVVTIDLEHPRVLGDVDLQDPRLAGSDAHPAVVWDLPRDRLFVVTQDSLRTIGLHSLAVSFQPIGGEEPEVTTPTAGAVLWGALSADGTRLYLTGLGQSLAGGGIRYAPIGLRLIKTADGSILAPEDPSIGQLTLSPTGERLLVASYPLSAASSPADGASLAAYDGEVRMLDPVTLEVLARIPVPEGAASPGPAVLSISWDGRYGYLGTYVRTGETGHSELQVLSLEDGREIARQTFDGPERLATVRALAGSCGGVAAC